MSGNNYSGFNPLFSQLLATLSFSQNIPWLNKPFVKVLIPVLFTLGAYLFVERLVMHLAKLPYEYYFQSNLTLSMLVSTGALKLIILGAMLLFLMIKASLLSKWQVFQQGQLIRYFILFLAFVIAWPLVTLGYNFYFNQGFYLDRIFLIILFVALWWRPVFIVPFIVLAFVMLLQLKQPDLGGSILAHKVQVLNVLILFAATFLIHAISGYRKTQTFVFMSCCLVAGAYWLPAITKLQLDWFNHGQLHYMTMAAYGHGWLGFLQADTVVNFAQQLAWLEWPMRIFVVTIEAGCLFFMLRPAVSMTLLGTLIVFHIGVFILIGFLFWTWILLDIGLIFLLIKGRQTQDWRIYTNHYFVLSIALIGFTAHWAKPPALGWFDTRVSYTYQIEAINQQGEQFVLAPEYFAPYEDIFTFSSFDYLVKEHSVLVGPYGVTNNIEKADNLALALNAEQIFDMENQQNNNFNQKRSTIFYAFIQQFVSNYNRNVNSVTDLRWLSPPRQFWSTRPNTVKQTKQPIKLIIVSEITTLYNDKSLEVIRKIELMRMEIN